MQLVTGGLTKSGTGKSRTGAAVSLRVTGAVRQGDVEVFCVEKLERVVLKELDLTEDKIQQLSSYEEWHVAAYQYTFHLPCSFANWTF